MMNTIAAPRPLPPRFAVLRFTPLPEVVEAVSVGILIDERGETALHYLPEFEKLRAVAPGCEVGLEELLKELRLSIRLMPLERARVYIAQRLGAPFRIEASKPLWGAVTEDVTATLLARYCKPYRKDCHAPPLS